MFKVRIRELRELAGYRSQQSFADAFGVAQSTVGGWESGKREPNYETTLRLADFLCTTVDYLMGRTDSPYMTPVPPRFSLRGKPNSQWAETISEFNANQTISKLESIAQDISKIGDKKRPTPVSESGPSDDDLIRLWSSLSPDEILRMKDFALGMIANRKSDSSRPE